MKKTALITGASSGIGFEFARLFAGDGYDLVLIARDEAKLRQAVRKIESEYPVSVHAMARDLSDHFSAWEVLEQTWSLGIRIDVLVNNAGVGLNGEFIENSLDDELRMIQLNITALVSLCHLFGRDMARRGTGRILNVASTAAFQPGPLMSNYYATKAYVLAFSEGLRSELEPRGVRITTLCPGPTETEFFERGNMKDSAIARAPNMMSAARVAEIGYAALVSGKKVVVAGMVNRLLAFTTRFSPRGVAMAIARALNQRRGTFAFRDA